MIENATILSISALSNPLWVLKPLIIVGWGVLFKYFSNLSGEIVGVIIGAVLAGSIIMYLTKIVGERSTKKYTSKALLSEIEVNQNRLRPLANVIKVWDKDRDEDTMENSHFPNEISFDRTIYSALSDKIGLLDSKSRDKVVQYYAKIKLAEEQYKKLELIHRSSLSVSDLISFKLIEELKESTGRTSSDLIEWDEIEECFTNAEEAYNTGKELIESLKGQT